MSGKDIDIPENCIPVNFYSQGAVVCTVNYTSAAFAECQSCSVSKLGQSENMCSVEALVEKFSLVFSLFSAFGKLML